ncbi:MAG: hypothetical protein ACRC5M_06880 [Anaeroplasmataceae bacterium]
MVANIILLTVMFGVAIGFTFFLGALENAFKKDMKKIKDSMENLW